jgi:hypothetical protein
MNEEEQTVTAVELVAFYNGAFATLAGSLHVLGVLDARNLADTLVLGPEASPAMRDIAEHLKRTIIHTVGQLELMKRSGSPN